MHARRLAAAAVAVILLAACSGQPPGHPHPAATRLDRPHRLAYVGFTGPRASVSLLAQRTGITPDITTLYARIGGYFPASAVRWDTRAGVLPVIQLDPPGSVTAVAAGAYDGWLRSAARDVATAKGRVAVGFAHEFSNPYWPWSFNHETPAAFIAAWRHIVTVFRRQGARNVAWVWTLSNLTGPRAAPLAPYWPGASYVTWVGIDGYYLRPQDTFASVFGPVLAQVRRFTADPMLITETGANPASGRVRAIGDLFRGAAGTPGVVGLIWFDYFKYGNHDWRINQDAAALAAFRREARNYH